MGSKPIGSMYGIFTYIWMIFGVYVGKYSSTMDPMERHIILKWMMTGATHG